MFMQLFFGVRRSSPATVEVWQWRYRDASTGRVCRTALRLTADEAARYPQAERVEGTLILRQVEAPTSFFRRRAGTRLGSPV
jgi:hypothetical protein